MFAIVPVLISMIFPVKYQEKSEPRYAAVREKVEILNGQLSNNLSDIAAIKSHTNEEYESGRILDSSLEFQQRKTPLDRIEIKKLQVRDLVTEIGLVSQDTFLIDGTRRENI